MTEKITIAIDAMGGENSPDKAIEGVSLFLKSIGFIEIFFEQLVIKIKEIINKIDLNNLMSRIVLFPYLF